MHIAYYRVSTKRQGQSGLGLEAQRKSVMDHIGTAPLAEFTEIESGRKADRPMLLEAVRMARATGATLVVAKLDRLSRNAAFLNTLMDSGLNVLFADMPNADRLVIGIMAQLAQWEAEQISKRTREALAATKARGTKLGGDRGNILSIGALGRSASARTRSDAALAHCELVRPYVDAARANGHESMRAIADYLNERHIKTAQGGKWFAASVRRVMAR